MGMPLNEFTDETYEGLAAGKEEVVVGMGKKSYDAFEPRRQEQFREMVKMMGGK